MGQETSFRWKVKRNSLITNCISKAKSHFSNESATVENEEDMNISQEILVLDFGDEKNHDFLRSAEPSTDFGKGETQLSEIFIFNFYIVCFLQIKL